jgi:demethylmenaquinone methyltransferase/2-methoxy-6-polyprenyl-1,4-benzoquinol methylase|tara:strand:- start:2581 stop:3285 length:705 start_codon:yes stop_codon:yes gene_type:complete
MKSYQKNSERFISKVFQDVFDKYDLMNDLMSLGVHRLWKKKFINYLNPQLNTKLIDVASGTGDIARLFLEKVNYRGHVYCVDENNEMLNLSKKKIKVASRVKWFCNNAEKLPFDKNFFDYYTISFGIRNVENIDIALKEAYRVLKPGGKFLCLEFSKVQNEFLNKFYQTYSKTIPKVGELIVGKSEPYKYLIDSIKKFYDQEEFSEQIQNQNFTNVTYKNLNAGVVAIHSAIKL